jgi:glutathione S-transferase
MLTVYGNRTSGNCYKLQLLLDQLDRPYAWVDVDSANGETQTEAFLARNANGKVPLLELDDGRRLAESNAIACFLAEGTWMWPGDAWERAQTLQWLFFEQYSHEPYIAVARFLCRFHPDPASQRALVETKMDGGYRALAVMEGHLAREPYFAAGRYTIADIALYAYTHVAGEGGFELARFPAIGAWLTRVEAQPGYVRMPD